MGSAIFQYQVPVPQSSSAQSSSDSSSQSSYSSSSQVRSDNSDSSSISSNNDNSVAPDTQNVNSDPANATIISDPGTGSLESSSTSVDATNYHILPHNPSSYGRIPRYILSFQKRDFKAQQHKRIWNLLLVGGYLGTE